MYECVVFDVDGTLIDTERAIMASLQKVLKEELGKEFSTEELAFVLGIPGTASLPKLGVKDVDKAIEKWNEYLKDYFSFISVFEGIEETLKELKKNEVKVGIVTSKTRDELECDFVPFGLMEYIDFSVCADDTVKHKPYPEPLLKLLEISGLEASKVVFIGDTLYDNKCASAAGIEFGVAVWGARCLDEFECSYRFEKPKVVLDVIASAKKAAH